MANLDLVFSDVDVSPFMKEVEAGLDLFALDRSRQSKIPAQRSTETIFLRQAKRRPDVLLNNNQESEPTKAAGKFPTSMRFIVDFAAERSAYPGRALLVRLAPFSGVSSHRDEGAYYALRDRFHLVLSSPEGSLMTCGTITETLKEGELWWMDNKVPHASVNSSALWRTHLIFDLLPASLINLACNPVTGTSAKDELEPPR